MKHVADDQLTREVMGCLRKIMQSVDLHSRFLLKNVGLTGPQLAILQVLADNDAVSVGDIARAVSLSQATVTGILERMEKRALLVRCRSEGDRRKVIVKATEAGKRIVAEAGPTMQASFIQAYERLEEWEQTMILSALQRLVVMMDNGKKTSGAAADGVAKKDPFELH